MGYPGAPIWDSLYRVLQPLLATLAESPLHEFGAVMAVLVVSIEFLFLVASCYYSIVRPGAPNSFLFLVVRPGAPSSVLSCSKNGMRCPRNPWSIAQTRSVWDCHVGLPPQTDPPGTTSTDRQSYGSPRQIVSGLGMSRP